LPDTLIPSRTDGEGTDMTADDPRPSTTDDSPVQSPPLQEAPPREKSISEVPLDELEDLDEIGRRLDEAVSKLSLALGTPCFPLFLDELDTDTVDDVFDQLRKRHAVDSPCLHVILDSAGGDIHSAYNLSLLLRRYATSELTFIVPRWAKSAATLLALSGDRILMTPVAELGPVDPQITAINPLERRVEHFSPLNIEATLQLIRDEYTSGESRVADGLMEKLQFPLTLGSFKASLEVGKEYLRRIFRSRMLKDSSEEQIWKTAERFVEGYSDHGFVIDCTELQSMGLRVEELAGAQLDYVWEVHQMNKRKEAVKRAEQREEMQKRIRQLPPELVVDRQPTDQHINGDRP